jgi:hypothetical protein
LELLIKAGTSAKLNRTWYLVSSEGLLEASSYLKGFSSKFAGTLESLTKLLGF